MSQVTSKRYKDYDKVSRYSVFPIYYHKGDKRYFYGLTGHLMKENTRYVAHKVVQNDTLDTLALYYYGNPTYYWIIADFNDIQDPYKPLTIGETLKIPTFSNISFNLQER